MIHKYVIYGERCSGTNYLEDIMTLKFCIPIDKTLGNKHFFGHTNLSNTDDTLFICIVRDFHKWANSLYQNPHHLSFFIRTGIHSFLNNEFFSFDDRNGQLDESNEFLVDRHIYSNERYKNVFEARHIKNQFLIEDLPKMVKNYLFIRYEDLIDDFQKYHEQN